MKKIIVLVSGLLLFSFLCSTVSFADEYQVINGEIKKKTYHSMKTIGDYVVAFQYVDKNSGETVKLELPVEARRESTAKAKIKMRYKKKCRQGTLEFLSVKKTK